MTQPIEEFLVGLGFKIDNKGFQAFTGGVISARSAVGKLGVAAIDTAMAVEKMVEKVSRQFEDLYYAAELGQTSVASLQDWSFAAQQIGISAGEAKDMVKTLGVALRTSPGVEAIAQSLGVVTRDKNGGLRDTTKILHDTVIQLSKLSDYVAIPLAAMFGMSASEYILLRDHIKEADAAAASFDERQKNAGINADKFAESSRKFDNDLRNLGSAFYIAGEQLAIYLQPNADAFTVWLTGVVDQLTGAKAVTDAWVASLINLGKILDAGLDVAALGLRAAAEVGTEATAFDDASRPISGDEKKTTASLMRAIMGMGWSKEAAAGLAANIMSESSGDPNAQNGSHWGIAQWDANRQADFAAKFGHDIHGSSLAEQLAFMNYELRQGKYKKRVGDRIGTGGDFGDSAYDAGYLVSRDYERPGGGLPGLIAAARGNKSALAMRDYNLGAVPGGGSGGGVVLNQNTNINVNGTSDPATTAANIGALQDTTNSRLVRHAQGATR